ncbi:RING finger protein 141-like [Limulus polyphemus]|uniref:RING finger protein 141-like n=1 Tax=Limulus polyphemus TaxID=6850 RepID=A0ABM1SUR2_LIMPO|nr:RING finger protein 141-like [Limulus polyphemus]
MGQSNSLDHQGIPVSEIKNEVLKHAAVLTEMAVLSYDNFLQMVKELNRISVSLPDKSGKKLVFLVKKRSDASIFWKSTVRIACVRVITSSGNIETYRLMDLKEFLQVYKMVTYHASAAPASCEPITEDAAGCSLDETSVKVLDKGDSRHCSVHKEFFDTSVILDGINVFKEMSLYFQF